ncbi:MAG TPA: hypothetical protein PLL69_11985, partial [Gemmatimonadales bacterium]|nr:hypothetical protein [Gemmatimonadales bacterium]
MSRSLVMMLGLALVVSACGKKEPEVVPTPTNPTQTGPTTISNNDDAARAAAEAARRDSIAAAEAARAALVNEMSSMIHFDYDQSAVRMADQALLNRKAAIMRVNP